MTKEEEAKNLIEAGMRKYGMDLFSILSRKAIPYIQSTLGDHNVSVFDTFWVAIDLAYQEYLMEKNHE